MGEGWLCNIDGCISSSAGDAKLLESHKAEIMAAFLCEYESNDIERNESIQDMVELTIIFRLRSYTKTLATFGREKKDKMSTTIRPKISEKNKYYIDKHRYYELKHFCLQYPLWEKQYNELSDFTKISDLKKNSQTNKITDYTAETVEKRLYYRERMDMVNKAANDADIELASYIFKAVTQGLSYEALRLQMNMPCSRDIYYDRYRRFFYLLSKYRR